MHCPDREFAATAYVVQAAPSGQPLSSIRYWDEGAASLMIKDLQPDDCGQVMTCIGEEPLPGPRSPRKPVV